MTTVEKPGGVCAHTRGTFPRVCVSPLGDQTPPTGRGWNRETAGRRRVYPTTHTAAALSPAPHRTANNSIRVGKVCALAHPSVHTLCAPLSDMSGVVARG